MIQAAAEAVVLFCYCTTFGVAGLLTVVQMIFDFAFGLVEIDA